MKNTFFKFDNNRFICNGMDVNKKKLLLILTYGKAFGKIATLNSCQVFLFTFNGMKGSSHNN